MFDVLALTGWPFVPAEFRQMVILYALIGFIALTTLMIWFIRRDGTVTDREMWVASGVATVYAVVATIVIGALAINRSLHEERNFDKETLLATPAQKETYLAEYESKNGELVRIPTGILLQSIEFLSAYNVAVSGYIWQRWDSTKIPADVTPGVIMPEGNVVTFGEPAYRISNGPNEEVIGWYFSTTLRQPFFYDKYPLDLQEIWIRVWPTDFHKNVVLVPDYASYPGTEFSENIEKRSFEDYAELIGLDTALVLERWNVNNAFFSYFENSYNTNFGIDNYQGQAGFPELYYNVSVTRDFFDAFFANVIPPIMVVMLSFMGLLLSTKIDALFERHATASSAMLAYYGMLFFIPITAQYAMRREVGAQGITYLDFFYFGSYIALILVSLNAILINSSASWGWLTMRNNIVPKIMFLPAVTAFIMGAMMVKYY